MSTSRDANGIRSICLGSRPSATLAGATDYFLASESVALKQLGFGNIVDILPGQSVFIQKGGKVEFRQIVERKSYTPDLSPFTSPAPTLPLTICPSTEAGKMWV